MKRYSQNMYGDMKPLEKGEWVNYFEASQEIDALKLKIEELQEKAHIIDNLQDILPKINQCWYIRDWKEKAEKWDKLIQDDIDTKIEKASKSMVPFIKAKLDLNLIMEGLEVEEEILCDNCEGEGTVICKGTGSELNCPSCQARGTKLNTRPATPEEVAEFLSDPTDLWTDKDDRFWSCKLNNGNILRLRRKDEN